MWLLESNSEPNLKLKGFYHGLEHENIVHPFVMTHHKKVDVEGIGTRPTDTFQSWKDGAHYYECIFSTKTKCGDEKAEKMMHIIMGVSLQRRPNVVLTKVWKDDAGYNYGNNKDKKDGEDDERSVDKKLTVNSITGLWVNM